MSSCHLDVFFGFAASACLSRTRVKAEYTLMHEHPKEGKGAYRGTDYLTTPCGCVLRTSTTIPDGPVWRCCGRRRDCCGLGSVALHNQVLVVERPDTSDTEERGIARDKGACRDSSLSPECA